MDQIGEHWLPPVLLHYRRRFPRVEVRIDVQATHQPIEMLLAGKIELGLMSTPVRDRRLVSRRGVGCVIAADRSASGCGRSRRRACAAGKRWRRSTG